MSDFRIVRIQLDAQEGLDSVRVGGRTDAFVCHLQDLGVDYPHRFYAGEGPNFFTVTAPVMREFVARAGQMPSLVEDVADLYARFTWVLSLTGSL